MGRVSSSVLIGREAELEVLTDALEAVVSGQPSAIVVSGEAGIGKTRLLREVRKRAHDAGAGSAIGGCIPLAEGSLPYAPVIAALRQGMTGLASDPTEVLSRETVSELARLLPELRAAGDEVSAARDQTRLFGAVLDLIRVLTSEKPLVLLIEDIHWSDPSTRDLLTYLLNMTYAERVMFVCSLRTGELDPSHPVPRWVQTIAGSRMAEVVELQPLTLEETRRQIRQITGGNATEDVVSTVFQRSEGNPFFVEELVQAAVRGVEELPPSLRELLVGRIAALSPEAIGILKTMSVDGPTVGHDLLVAAAGIDHREITPLLQTAIDRHLLVRSEDESYSFRHALLREAVYRRLLPGERRVLHRSFAEALERQESGTTEPGARAGRLARHWQEAGEPQKALPHALAAAGEAEASYASAEALAHYEQALRLWDRLGDAEQISGTTKVAVLQAVADAADRAGRPEVSVAFWEEAIDLVDPAEDPAGVARMLSALAYVRSCTLMDAAGAQPLLQRAQELVKDLPPSIDKVDVLCHASASLVLGGQIDEGLAVAKVAMEIAEEVGDPSQRSNALSTLALAYHQKGDLEEAIAQYLLAIELARQPRDAAVLRRTLTNLSDALFRANRPEEAVTCALDAVDELHRLGDENQQGMLRCNVGEFLTALGRWDEVEELIVPLEDAPLVLDRAFSASLLAEIDVGRGRFEQARARLGTARRLLVNMNEPQFLDPIALTEILLALCERRHDDASDRVRNAWDLPRDERGLARLCALGVRVEADRAVRSRASGDSDAEQQAIRVGEEIEEACPKTGPAEVTALHRTVAAEATRLRGRSDPARWGEAIEAWEEVSFRLPHAYTLYRYGESLLSAADRKAAQQALSAAGAEADALGAAPLALDIAGLARRGRLKLSGETKPASDAASDSRPPSDLGLTHRELEVLRSLGEGLTNRQIAETLFISPKTASIHVSSILAKLGVSNRLEAARRAFDAGLLDRTHL